MYKGQVHQFENAALQSPYVYALCLSHRWTGAAIVRKRVFSVEAAGLSFDHPDIDEAPNEVMVLVRYGFDQ